LRWLLGRQFEDRFVADHSDHYRQSCQHRTPRN
jgi:hypothetical protein